MACYLCQADAVTRCYSCGQLVCAEHGKNDHCTRCSTGFMAGDPGISGELFGKPAPGGWWRPQEAEEYQPPACYECKGLTRAVCRNCQANYCPEHAGPNGLCKACGRSANLGLYIVVGMVVLITLVFLFSWLLG